MNNRSLASGEPSWRSRILQGAAKYLGGYMAIFFPAIFAGMVNSAHLDAFVPVISRIQRFKLRLGRNRRISGAPDLAAVNASSGLL